MSRSPSPRSLFVAPVAAVIGSLVVAAPALAHTGRPVTGWASGLVHPLLGPDHLLAMVAVGIVAATLADRTKTLLVPLAFVAGMVAGGLLAMVGLSLPGGEVLIALSVMGLGLAVAGAVDLGAHRTPVVLAFLAAAGAVHGVAHGAEAPASANLVAYVAGFVATTIGLHLAGASVGVIIGDRRTVRLGMGLATLSAGALLVL